MVVQMQKMGVVWVVTGALKVMGNAAIRQSAYDYFLFDFNRNYVSIFCRFYRAMLCIRGTSRGPVSVSVCLCLSVTSRSSTKTSKRRITQTNTSQ